MRIKAKVKNFKAAILFLVCAQLLFFSQHKLNAQVKRPNVLIILTDDENVNTLGCYGYNVKTPNIDNLAAEGIRFTNANVVHTVCSPSRYSILTGRYYDNNTQPDFLEKFPSGTPSCIGNNVMLEKDGMNVAALLKNSGYTTGFVGKAHFTREELLYTNEEWKKNGLQTYDRTGDPRKDPELDKKLKANHQWWCETIKEFGFDYVNGVYAANQRELFNDYLNVHNVEWTADASVRFIEEQKDKEEPFFLYVSTTYPHGPAPERMDDGNYIYSLDADPSLTGEGVVENNIEQKLANRKRIKDNIDPKDDKTSGPAEWWDSAVGSIVDKLKETGQFENTLIIYTSDHGKLNSGKTTLYETGVHVPLIIHWPNEIKDGRVYDHIIGSVDFTPTILDVCDAKIPNEMHMDGVSFKSVINGSNDATRDALLVKMGYAAGVKTEDWKYIAVRYPISTEQDIQAGKTFAGFRKETLKQPYYFLQLRLSQKSSMSNPHYFERNQLYNYKNDLWEENNVFLNEKETAIEMQELLERELKKMNSNRSFGEFVGKDKEKFMYLKNKVNYPE